MKYVGILSTYSHIFGEKKRKEDIVRLIQEMPSLTSFVLLSQISTDNYNENELKHKLKNLYLNKLHEIIEREKNPSMISIKSRNKLIKNIEKLDETVTFPPQSILNLWKWFLVYGRKDKLKSAITDTNIAALVNLSLMTNDYLYLGNKSKESLYAEVFSNYVFNHEENPLNTISRTFAIYTVIANDLSNSKNYLDVNNDFVIKYGYSIKEHIAVIFGLIAIFMSPKVLGEQWIQNIESTFSKSHLHETSKEIVSSLIVNIDEASKWASQNIDTPWNFQKFREKPLLLVNKNEYLPFSQKLLKEQLFSGLFHKVRHVYPLEDRSFLDFYGKPFEKYTEILMDNAIKHTQLPYLIIPEFRYKKTKDSPDLMIRLGNKLLAIEVKSYRLRLPSITDGDVHSINKDIKKMVISPLKQVHDRINELLEDNHKNLEGVTDIYFMVVTQGHFPTIAFFEDKIHDQLESHFNIKPKGHYHLDIEEFEMLCHLMERRRPIFRVLENKNKSKNKFLSFKNFLMDNNYHIRKNKFLDEMFLSSTKEIEDILFTK
ncbi:hypothetical protein J0K78_05030 [Halobacillus sp. GSS1]|uniref:hypothetical protein n=1 Tax=Halobacillus sp. GSS1 TaxID=2815919 RepID=UPI001A8D4DB7|nr:hypothetical protein [Halobacillus sp. GSS1]MBN9653624.1 hypothetical protein [Halobacillus sp. GSS1]